MRGRTLVRFVATAQVVLLAGALIVPTAVAAATLGFTLNTPTVSTVSYSDLVTLRGAYTCVNDAVSTCPTTLQSSTARFSLRPSGGSTFLEVASVTSSFNFTSSAGGCPTTCTRTFQVTYKAGRAGSTSLAPGVYDIGLTTTLAAGQQILADGLTITQEGTTTAYGGLTTGLGNTSLALSATVADADLGLGAGNSVYSPDTNLLGAGLMTFALYDASNTTLLAGPVSATVLSSGLTTGSPSLLLPSAGGSLRLRTTFAGNAFYTTSADLDVISVTPSNTPPTLAVPESTIVEEATSAAGAVVNFAVTTSDAEDEPDPAATCDWQSGDTFPIGTTTVSCSVTDSGGMEDGDEFDVTVEDTTDPVVSIATTESIGGSGWYNVESNDDAAGLTVDVTVADLVGSTGLACTDKEVPLGTLPPAGGSFVLGDGLHLIECAATDAAGNTAGDDASFRVDQTAPSIDAALTPGADATTGWWNLATGAPTVTYACADTGSGLASCTDPLGFGESADQGHIGMAVDAAGNVATTSVSDVDVDLTAPSIGAALAPEADGTTGWWNAATGAPTVTYTCADTGSGLAACTAPFGFGEGADQANSGTAIDAAGNAATTGVSDVDVDLTAPSVAFVGGGLTAGASYVFGAVPAGPTACTATDAGSGIVACGLAGYAATGGSHAIVATAGDVAGNTATAVLAYEVLPWTLVGFGNPVSMTSPNLVKGGANVNLKFEVFAGGTELTSLESVAAITQTQVSCGAALFVATPTPAVSTRGSSLKYDGQAGQFFAKFDAPSGAGTCWEIAVVTADGSSLAALFRIK